MLEMLKNVEKQKNSHIIAIMSQNDQNVVKQSENVEIQQTHLKNPEN